MRPDEVLKKHSVSVNSFLCVYDTVSMPCYFRVSEKILPLDTLKKELYTEYG
jgi:hypothetical protein